MTYFDKLKDPRWQKKRLKILERDEFTCQLCNSTDKTLNVHHLFYFKNHDPWDYLDTMLLTLCQDCHGEMKDVDVAKYILEWLFRGYDINELHQMMCGVPGDDIKGLKINSFIWFMQEYPTPTDSVYEKLSVQNFYANKNHA